VCQSGSRPYDVFRQCSVRHGNRK